VEGVDSFVLCAAVGDDEKSARLIGPPMRMGGASFRGVAIAMSAV
jgi:hypothetical protein